MGIVFRDFIPRTIAFCRDFHILRSSVGRLRNEQRNLTQLRLDLSVRKLDQHPRDTLGLMGAAHGENQNRPGHQFSTHRRQQALIPRTARSFRKVVPRHYKLPVRARAGKWTCRLLLVKIMNACGQILEFAAYRESRRLLQAFLKEAPDLLHLGLLCHPNAIRQELAVIPTRATASA